MLPIFGGLAPAFLLRLTGRLDLTVDDHMMSKLQENPLIAPLLMDAFSLIGATSGVSSDEEFFEEHLPGLDAPEAIVHLLRVLVEHMGDEVALTVTHPQLGLQMRLVGKGMKEVAKSVAKYIPRKEEQQ